MTPTTLFAGTARRQSLFRAVVFEWVKVRTLRSTWIGMASVVLILIGFGALAAAILTGSVSAPPEGGPPLPVADPLSVVLTGANLAVLVVAVLGCLAGAREYSSRMITASLAAAPRRWQLVVSKASVFGALTALTTTAGVFGAFWLGMAILSADGAATVSLSDAGVLRAVLGTAAYLTAIALLGLGLGVALRSVSGSIGVVVAGLLILPGLAGALLPESWQDVLKYAPSSAAAAFTATHPAGTQVLGVGAGAAVVAAWVLAALTAATITITRRDA